MTAMELLTDLQRQGFHLIPLPEGKLAVTPKERLTDSLRAEIRQWKGELMAVLTRPYLNTQNELIIPFTADRRYHWWNGGQSIRATLLELDAPADILGRYVEVDLTVKH